jgi:hypothetical protein
MTLTSGYERGWVGIASRREFWHGTRVSLACFSRPEGTTCSESEL